MTSKRVAQVCQHQLIFFWLLLATVKYSGSAGHVNVLLFTSNL